MSEHEAHVRNLVAVASELVVRLRDDNTEANARWLRAVLPCPTDWFQLAFVLASAVPDDQSWGDLTAWLDRPLRRRSGGPE